MLNQVEITNYAAAIKDLRRGKAVDLVTLKSLEGFRPIDASPEMIEARLKTMLSDATFNPPLPLFTGIEPHRSNQLAQTPLAFCKSAQAARAFLEVHFSVGNNTESVKLGLFWQPQTLLYGWRASEPEEADKPASASNLGMAIVSVPKGR